MPDGEAARQRQLEVDRLAQEVVGKLDQDAGAVAGVHLGAAGAAVLQRVEHLEGALYGGVRGPAGQVGDRADAAGVVLEGWVIEAHGLRSLCVHAAS